MIRSCARHGLGFKRMKKLITLCFLCLVGKATAQEVNALTLWMASGSKVVYMLDEQPVVKFKEGEFVLSTQMNVISYPAEQVLKFTHSYAESTGIMVPGASCSGFSFDGNSIKASNLEPHSEIEVYSVDGALLFKATTDNNGCVCMPITPQPGNVCIIKTSVANFKIMKP